MFELKRLDSRRCNHERLETCVYKQLPQDSRPLLQASSKRDPWGVLHDSPTVQSLWLWSRKSTKSSQALHFSRNFSRSHSPHLLTTYRFGKEL